MKTQILALPMTNTNTWVTVLTHGYLEQKIGLSSFRNHDLTLHTISDCSYYAWLVILLPQSYTRPFSPSLVQADPIPKSYATLHLALFSLELSNVY